MVRLTTFVESGPLVAVAPKWVERVTPLPVWRGMGWGLELEWIDLQAEGCRLGIVDATTVVHLGPVARELRHDRASGAPSRGARGPRDE